MSHAYTDIAFTPSVRAVQTRMGSRAQYEGFDQAPERGARLREREAAFIEARDGFYQASVGETGWPYVQFRGGPAGFLKVLDDKTLGYADFRGNVQYISVGNLGQDSRVALILMDYANQARLKLLGRARLIDANEDPALIERLRVPGYRAKVERAVLITVEGFDWNCPQHITPRFTEAEIEAITAPLRRRLHQAQQELAQRPHATAAPPRALGDGPLALVVAGMRQLTPRVRAYELHAADGEPLPAVRAGSHIQLPIRMADGATALRAYSIASDARRRDVYEIAVLLEDEGRGGSKALHADYRLGSRLNAAYPVNTFPLHDDLRPAVLVAGGIGVTPIRALAAELAARGQAFQIHYAIRSRAEAAFLNQLEIDFGERLHLYASDTGRRLQPARLFGEAATDAVFYVCGPASLIDAVRHDARVAGIAEDRVRFERFAAADLGLHERPVTLRLQRSGKRVDVAPDRSLLEALEAAGVDVLSSCRVGTCGTCAVKVLAGMPDHRDQALSDAERHRAGLMCVCISRAHSSELTLDL